MGYIKVAKVYEKLKKAEEFCAPVLMTAGVGWGKSAAAEYYYRRKKPLILFCKNGKIQEKPDIQSFRGSVVIIEDMQWLSDEEDISYLRELLHTQGIQVVMIKRGEIPKYLAVEAINLDFVRIQERDLALSEKEIGQFLKEKGINASQEDICLVTEATQGYLFAIHCYAARMEEGQHYSEDMRAAVWQDLYHLWDGAVYEEWDSEFVHFALCVCRYEEFTLEMAEYLTGSKQLGDILEYCREVMNLMEVKDGGYYSVRPETRGYFCWKQNLLWSEAEIMENYRRAANYYEMKEDIPNALKYYRKAKATQRIKELLIRNANMHPGNGQYVETQEYYFELSDEEIKDSPVLMAGMSMLCDLILLPEKSEKWYQELLAFYEDTQNSREKRREAKTRLAYLDIALPHRGIKGIMRIMKGAFSLVRKGDITLPEFCATGNMPSIMNGGLDFSEWSKKDHQIAKFMGKPIETILGRFGKGLVTLALAESGFEKGTMPAYEVLTRCNNGFEAALHGGRIEMAFVSVGIQMRQHIIEGQLPSAKRLYESFLEKIKLTKVLQLEPNMEAMGSWLSLFSGVNGETSRYIEMIPDAKLSFDIMERYRQMMKARCLIAENRLEEALEITLFLNGYFVNYERFFYQMENNLLIAVILYRRGDEHWKTYFYTALQKASEFHFVRLVSIEGAAVLPLFKQMIDEGELEDIDEAFLEQTYDECVRVAMSFPDYMRFIPKETISLTTREAQVLSMLCAGNGMEEISRQLNVGYDTVKKYNSRIYKKLRVKTRAEAERKAIRLGLVHRGEIDKEEL